MIKAANQAGVRNWITSSRLPPTRASIININVNSINDRMIRHRWQGPGFTFVFVISMKLGNDFLFKGLKTTEYLIAYLKWDQCVFHKISYDLILTSN